MQLHGDGNLAVPQDSHCHTWVDVERRQQRTAGAAGVVYADAAHSSLGAS
jgi:hypothetical protein